MGDVHYAFSDESHWNHGRYRGLGLVTLKQDTALRLRADLQALLHESNVTEFRWSKLDGAKERFAALKLCRKAIDCARKGEIRLDILGWDAEDERHRVTDRDDVANLQRMYYHLFKNVLRERWLDEGIWCLYPDEHAAMDWMNVQDFLGKVDTTIEMRPEELFSDKKLSFRLKREFHLEEIQPTDSSKEPFIQLADLFVGLAIFSRGSYKRFCIWKNQNDPQMAFFEEKTYTAISRSEPERFRVLNEFDNYCKRNGMGVSLKTHKKLITLDPARPINFWWYEPQHELDKAPKKVRITK